MKEYKIAITDKNFNYYLLENFDKEYNGYLTNVDCESITHIDCRYRGIKNMQGVECFSNLKMLSCCGNDFAELILPWLPNLTTLFCSFGNLKRLDLKGCPNLEYLVCNGNDLKDLDLGDCRHLTTLFYDTKTVKNLILPVIPQLRINKYSV